MPANLTDIAESARGVLRHNDRGRHTVAAPSLYPHQWSWDAAFNAIGIAHLDVERALVELDSLLAGQWSTGMIPHIVFSDAPGYFPGPERWRTERAAASPPNVATSGICQPPVHGLALYVIAEHARKVGSAERGLVIDFVRRTFGAWYRWYRWLFDVRAHAGSTLVTIHHSWESGMDNSPRWDSPYRRVEVGDLEAFARQDLKHVADAAQRPSDDEYRRYLWLVHELSSVDYDDAQAAEVVSFRVGDVFFSGIFVLAANLLAELGDEISMTGEASELRAMASAIQVQVENSVCPETLMARDVDYRTGQWMRSATIASFAPLISGTAPDMYTRQVGRLMGPQWCGHARLRWPLPPTTGPDDDAFVPDNYWRGPQWPVVSWLLTFALRYHGHVSAAEGLTRSGLNQLADLSFSEYFNAVDGAALGSHGQSWTAAAALDWVSRIQESQAP